MSMRGPLLMLRRGAATAILFVLCLLLVQCGIGRKSAETVPDAGYGPEIGVADVVAGDGVLEIADKSDQLDIVSMPGDTGHDIAELDGRAPDEIEAGVECPPSICEVGFQKCKYANTSYVECLEVPGCPGVGGNWSGLVPCPDGLVCVEGVGCTCKYGVCEPDDNLDEVCDGTLLEQCKEWVCKEGCCQLEPVAECCLTGQDCRDCINLESGDTILCPEEVPEGYVENLCTWDVCLLSECENTDKVANGQCDDGDPCTKDLCDAVNGGCMNIPKDCDDDNPCTTDSCDPDQGCVNTPDDQNLCDDGDPETVNVCQDGECVVVE